MIREDLIQYILGHDPKTNRANLDQLSLENLVFLKVRLEIIKTNGK